jgi:DNA-directed RNA polymerase specialized sigma subunit
MDSNIMSSMGNYLEDEHRPAFEAWQADQTPAGNATFLKHIDPIVQKGVKMYGDDSPLSASRARLVALDAVRKYDPARSRLQSHMLNQMQGLRRATRKQQEVIRVPERVLLESQRLREYSQEIQDEMGREPTDAELSDRLGISLPRLTKIRQYQPGMSSGRAESGDPMQGQPASQVPGQREAEDYWAQIVYQDLGPMDQKIMELTLGMNGHKKLSNQEVAKKMNRSPGAITQRKMRIQTLLDQETDLSPFVVSE